MSVDPIATTTAVTAALKPGTAISSAHPQLHVAEREKINEVAAALDGLTVTDVTGLTAALAAKVPTARTVTAGTGLTGGGDLSADRTLTVDYAAAAFVEAVQDTVAAMVTSGANVTLTYNDTAGTLSVTASGGDAELMRDTIGAAIVGTSGISVAVNDGADTITLSVATGAITSGMLSAGVQAALADARTPLAHKASHAAAGSDPLAPSDIGAAGVSSLSVDADGYGTVALGVGGGSPVTVPLRGWTIPGVTGPTEVYYSDFKGWNSGVTADRRAALTAAMTAATTGRQRPVAFVPNPSGTRWYFGGATEGQLPIPAQGLHLKGLSSSAGPLERDDQVTLMFDNVGDIFAWPAGDYFGYTQDNICLSGAQVAGGAGTTTFFDQIGTGRRLFDFRFINGASFKFFQHVIRGSLGRGDFGGGQAWHINGGGGTQLHLFGSDFHFTGMLYLDQFPMPADQASAILENATLADFRAYITPAPHMGLYVKNCKDVDIDVIINGLNDHAATAYANTAAFPAAASSLHLLAKDSSSGITYRSNGTNWSEVYRNASAATSGSTFPGSPTAGAMHYLTGAGLDSGIDAFRYDSAGARWHGPMFRPAVTGDVYYDGASGPLAMFEGCHAIRASMRLRAGGLKAWSFQKGTVMVLNPPSGSEIDMSLTQEYLLPVQDCYGLLVQAGYGGGGARWKLRDLISAQHPGGAPTIYAAVTNSGSAYTVDYERDARRVLSGAGKTTVNDDPSTGDFAFRFPPVPGARYTLVNTTDNSEKIAVRKQNGTWAYLTPS